MSTDNPSDPKGASASDPVREIPVEVLPPQEGAKFHTESATGGSRTSGESSFLSPKARWVFSLALAAIADAAQAVFPPDWVFMDGIMVVALLMLWGLRWEIAAVLLPEMLPGVSVFPTWTLLVMYLGKKYGGGSSE